MSDCKSRCLRYLYFLTEVFDFNNFQVPTNYYYLIEFKISPVTESTFILIDIMSSTLSANIILLAFSEQQILFFLLVSAAK